MGGCCVPGCSNSSDKKFLMKLIPSDPRRRQQWIKNIGRENWVPSKHAAVCEVHFEKHMWEKTREDGKRALKITAIPTIFPNRNPNELTENQSINDSSNKSTLHDSHSESQEQSSHDKIINNNRVQKQNRILIKIVKPTCPNQNNVNLIDEPTVLNIKRNLITLNDDEKWERANRIISKQQKLLNHYIKVNRELRNTKQTPSFDNYKKIVESLFNTDQIKYLRIKLNNGKRVKNWSNETIEDAVQLKDACGTRGYKELLKRGFPYPALRSLRSRQGKLL